MLLTVLLLLTSCQSGAALREFTKGDLLASYDFTNAATFEEGTYPAATMQVIDGNYQIDIIQADNVLWWGQWGESYGDVVIDVDTFQESEANGNAYGVMCRVQGNVGQAVEVDPTLAAIMESTSEPSAEVLPTGEATSEATAESTMAVTEAATSEATSESVVEATAESTTKSTDEATANATAEATSESTREATAVAESTTEATTEAVEPVAGATTEATTEATSEATSEASEPLLTATPQPTPMAISTGNGYLFLIQGGGSFSILRARGRNLTPLVEWTNSSAINQGPAPNHIRAVCVGNYLAMYVNDVFLGDATDDTYTSGQVGLGASSASRAGTRIDFDNLTISAAVPK